MWGGAVGVRGEETHYLNHNYFIGLTKIILQIESKVVYCCCFFFAQNISDAKLFEHYKIKKVHCEFLRGI